MPTEKERLDVIKSMAYDLTQIIEEDADKMYSPEDIKKLIAAYVKGAQQ